MAWLLSGKARVCKTLIREFDSPPGLGPSGGTGIHARLKIVCRKACGFKSHLGHFPPCVEVGPPLAQLAEQIPLKDKVGGSIPSGRIRLPRW